ncbi:P-loop containing nucleoside triphosphate hydrolase protein [Mycena rosella]|uniref:P-loop containing nucleoside triphosphate hydrolase protein n=1 Tax=Mycena rosella TaxID=1033263 RepID=A0AAD7DA31_MYCRO|nr:P-loop containing nucleoside triphosphate hydrolase protein [Mycena rosella]
MDLCNGSPAFDLASPCVRGLWSATVPAFVVLGFCALAVLRRLLPPPVRRLLVFLTKPFTPYMTVEEAQVLNLGHPLAQNDLVESTTGRRHSLFLAVVGLLEVYLWGGQIILSLLSGDTDDMPRRVQSLVIALTWLYTVTKTIIHPCATVPFDLLTIYVLHGAGGIFMLGGYLFDYAVEQTAFPSRILTAGLCANMIIILCLLYVVVRLPVTLPPRGTTAAEMGKSVSPEDYTLFWSMVTFSWIYPLIKHGINATLNEADVWSLSPTLQFASLLRRIWATAYQDLTLDFVGTLCSIVFSYARPFFLKRLLDSIDHPHSTRSDQARAYIFTAIILVCSLLQAAANGQHLLYCRRAATRVRSELMAAIYEKALKRKDTSGIVNREQAERRPPSASTSVSGAATPYSKNSIQPPKSTIETKPSDQARSSADPGTIVNLMSGDCTRVSGLISMLFTIYGAPFEIIIGSLFLYQLLGWSAFTGFVVVLMGWPLHKYITERNIRLHKSYLKARDRRVGVLDEMISAIKFIKFFAWEDRWMDRTLDARAEEMEWLTGFRTNLVMFYGLWNLAPVSLSLISFATYVWLGNELTVGTAFAAIQAFAMIKDPLASLPMALVQLIQGRIAVDRIAAFLNEDEVSDQGHSPDSLFRSEDALGVENASFRWNEGPGVLDNLAGQESASVDVDDRGSTFEVQTFELSDISVRFPEGKLSIMIITGPTASGKTALLMALLGEMTMLPGGGRIIMAKDNSMDEHGNIRGIAYAAQSPWLRHQSIRDNILFGSLYEESRYGAVVECCALGPDFDMLEDGDATEIGVKGVTLSGGQKASAGSSGKVSLTLAVTILSYEFKVYARKKYVLLDDPLSAVDSDTARIIYQKCLRGPLLKDRTVVLVTHHDKLVLPGAYYFIRMEDGRITVQGTVADLRSQSILESIARTAAWPDAADHPMFYIGVYAALGLFGVIMSLINIAVAWTAALNASRILFRKLLTTVVRATFRFHDTTPQGRLMNRLSKDFETIDSSIASMLRAVGNAIAEFFVSLMTIAYVFPPFLLPASIIGRFYWIIATGYLRTGRDLRRMESNTRSPIFSEFGELLAGIVTVRASLTVFTTALFAVTFLHNAAGLAGVVITSALSFGTSFGGAHRRILDLPQEPPPVVDFRRPPAYWPSNSRNDGLIVVEDLVVRYAPDLPPVLKGISFQLKAGERVGLVGRTGSGKSSLAMSLLRFVDPSEGKIIIDGIDITSIGTYDLRSRVTFIPQDAALVSGSLRDNLDPFGEFEDSQCLEVLHRVNLIARSTSRNQSLVPSPIPSRPQSPGPSNDDIDADTDTAVTLLEVRTTVSLDMQVSAGGSNFSQGQRQLIAIARALLRHTAIVVLDEATSSVDFATDAHTEGHTGGVRGSTLITVAHRLRTIVDYDRILVLEKGKVAEFDSPWRLLRKEGGIIRNMCLKSGYFGELEMAAQAKEVGVSESL